MEYIDKITFELEGGDEEIAFYSIYNALRMFKELEDKKNTAELFLLEAAETFLRLEEMKEQYPQMYAKAELLYEAEYKPMN